MELRSTAKRKENTEFKELQITLMGLGFYEEGMELQEMRQLVSAVQASMTQNLPGTRDNDMEQAIKESELDFLPMQDIHNSTMISIPNSGPTERSNPIDIIAKHSYYQRNSSSPFSSPEISPQQILVEAEIHHDLSWSPQKPESVNTEDPKSDSSIRLTRKRSSTGPEDGASMGPRIEAASKRSRLSVGNSSPNRTPSSETTDSGISSSSITTSTTETTESSESSDMLMTPQHSHNDEDSSGDNYDEYRDYDFHNHSAEPSF